MNLFARRYRDGERLDIEGLPVRLTVNRRARRVCLRIDRALREAVAVAPSASRLADAAAFARTRRAWIDERLSALPAPRPLRAAEPLAVFGDPWRLTPDGRRPRLVAAADGAPSRLTGCGAGEVDGSLVARAVRRKALEVFKSRAEAHCRGLGVAVPALSLSEARTRWGSCSAARPGRAARVRISWRLALAPLAVADYVVAHECAHLVEANHGPRFWSLVRRLIGDETPHRVWLRSRGEGLHARDFRS
ncbi:MAG: M48 family metallopeptidase [Caulobacteraceae bacterium]